MATNNSDTVVSEDENETAKRVYTSIGDTPGKPNRKTRRISRNHSTTSRSLFKPATTSPKTKV